MIGASALPAYTEGTPRVADHAMRCAQAKQLCAELGIAHFDTLAVFATFKHWRPEAAADGAHPGARGYAEMAEVIAAGTAWQTFIAGQ